MRGSVNYHVRAGDKYYLGTEGACHQLTAVAFCSLLLQKNAKLGVTFYVNSPEDR